jgi:Family of unknown function (DUF5906)/Bifunctional DNA primase/polymerase, N-terminal
MTGSLSNGRDHASGERGHSAVDVRLAMWRNGYLPIPCNGKVPAGKEWQKRTDTNEEEIRLWDKVFEYDSNSGCLTRNTPTLDVDITDSEASRAVFLRIKELLKDHGKMLCRVGSAPKFAITFRTDAPFKKVSAPVTSPAGVEMKLEFLADGQQFIAFGRHPDTGTNYRWWSPDNQQQDLTNVPRKELPVIDEAGANALIKDLVGLLVRDFGFQEKKPKPPKGPSSTRPRTGKTTAYGRKALAEELECVRKAVKGERNDELNKAVFAVYQLVGGGEIDGASEDIEGRFYQAAVDNGMVGDDDDDGKAARKTIQSAKGEGLANPRSRENDDGVVDEKIYEMSFASAKEAYAAVRDIHEAALAQMNEIYATLMVGGKFRVMTEAPHHEFRSQRMIEFATKNDFVSHVAGMYPVVPVPEQQKGTNIWQLKRTPRVVWWLSHRDRRRFDNIDFVPAARETILIADPDVKSRRIAKRNTWSGFTIVRAKGDCGLYLKHVKDHVCRGDEVLYEYTLSWLASGVQHPEDPCRTALSLRGEPGVGKGIFARQYGLIFGRHFIHLTQREHVVGKFNAHTAESCLNFADETLFVGDKRDADIIKTLVSERGKMLERKFIDPVSVRNFARLIFASNHDHPLRIDAFDRRYVGYEVCLPSGMMGTSDAAARERRKYFGAIDAQMEHHGGRAALLDVLLDRDISEFNPEAIPQTKELDRQKLLSASGGDRFIIGIADSGLLPGATIRRPWIARSHVDDDRHGLLDRRRKEGGKDLTRASDNELTDILKEWGFTKFMMMDGNGWKAPALDELRKELSRKYQGLIWDGTPEWRHPPAEEEEIQPDARRTRSRGPSPQARESPPNSDDDGDGAPF